MKRERTYDQVIDGEWFDPVMRDWSLQCCDCGLVHRIDFRKLRAGIRMKMRIDKRATSAVRRHKKKPR